MQIKQCGLGLCCIIGCLLVGCAVEGNNTGQESISGDSIISENATISENTISENESQQEEGILLRTEYLTITEEELLTEPVAVSANDGRYKGLSPFYVRVEGNVEDYALYHDFLMGTTEAYDTHREQYHTLEDVLDMIFYYGIGEGPGGVDILLFDISGDGIEELIMYFTESTEFYGDGKGVQRFVFGYEDGQLVYSSQHDRDIWVDYLTVYRREYVWNNGIIETTYTEDDSKGGLLQYFDFDGHGTENIILWRLFRYGDYEDVEGDVYEITVYGTTNWSDWDEYGITEDATLYVTESGELLDGDERIWEIVQEIYSEKNEGAYEVFWLTDLIESGELPIVRATTFFEGNYWRYMVEGRSGDATVSSVSLNDLSGNYLTTVNVPEGYCYVPELSNGEENLWATFTADGETIRVNAYASYDLQFGIMEHSHIHVPEEYIYLRDNESVSDYRVEITELEPVAGGVECFVAREIYTYCEWEGEDFVVENYYICVPYIEPYFYSWPDHVMLDFVNIELGSSASDWTTEQFQEMAYEVFGE